MPSSPRGLSFHVLGRLEAYYEGVEFDLGPRKQRAVLALLLLSANRVVSMERLIDELWGDAPPSTARTALQVYVAGLRKALNGGGTSRGHARRDTCSRWRPARSTWSASRSSAPTLARARPRASGEPVARSPPALAG